MDVWELSDAHGEEFGVVNLGLCEWAARKKCALIKTSYDFFTCKNFENYNIDKYRKIIKF